MHTTGGMIRQIGCQSNGNTQGFWRVGTEKPWLTSHCVVIEFIASAMRSTRNKKGKLVAASWDY